MGTGSRLTRMRLSNIHERELLMNFPKHHTVAAAPCIRGTCLEASRPGQACWEIPWIRLSWHGPWDIWRIFRIPGFGFIDSLGRCTCNVASYVVARVWEKWFYAPQVRAWVGVSIWAYSCSWLQPLCFMYSQVVMPGWGRLCSPATRAAPGSATRAVTST